ncbi:MAG: hypothetical protein LHW44_00025 [Candidatus Cloacimonetes bacterium]|nr:hypothetical protein [Candidatus Cloacimonadota bacterium]
MSLHQKESLYTLICSVVFFVLLLVLPLVNGSISAEVILLLFALFILCLWFIRQRLGIRFSKLNQEERMVRFLAAMIAVHAFGAVVAVYAIVLYLLHRSVGQVPLPQVLLLATHSWLSLYAFWSLFILIIHKWGVPKAIGTSS